MDVGTVVVDRTRRLNPMSKLLARFLKNEEAVTAIEYGLIAALIAVVIIVAITSVGTNLSGVFNAVANSLATATS
jgi:pilus assembly protein Flp/PilA